jgi:multicomponent Na+:H+ antiporter subunit E
MLRHITLGIALFGFWILMSGYFTPFLLAAGIGSSVAVVWLARRMEIADWESRSAHLTFAALTYWPWLMKEIVKSGLQVSRIIVHPRLPISPTLVTFRPSQQSAIGLATHANSITLTPGTITVQADHQQFLVHALTSDGAQGCIDSEMDRRVRRFEGRA